MTGTEDNVDPRWIKSVMLLRDGKKLEALYLLKSLANDGERAALREIGNIYEMESSGGVSQDFKKSRQWYIKAIEEGNDAYGCLGMARLLYWGKLGEKNPELAYEYLSMVEDSSIAEVQLFLGLMFHKGKGVSKDTIKARKYYKKSYNMGNVIALRNLARLEWGEGRYFIGFVLSLKAAMKIFHLVFKTNGSDVRLRSPSR